MERSSRVRSGTLEVTSSLPPRWSRKVRSLTLWTWAPSTAATASVVASAWRASAALQVRSTTSRSGWDSTMSARPPGPYAPDIDSIDGIDHNKRLEEWLRVSYGGDTVTNPTRELAGMPSKEVGPTMPSRSTTRTHDSVLPEGPWDSSPRWRGIRRDYRPEDVLRLRSTLPVEHTLARHGAERLWALLSEEDYVACLGALTGGQAVQMVKAGLQAIYLSGWQVAADANLGEQVYPDQSLYPANSVPAVVRRINNALHRADLVERMEGGVRDWFVPIVADAEAGFGGALNAYELMRAMIEAGAAGVHFEDQLASEKKCGHLGGKVLVPTAQFVRTLTAARLAADVCGVPTVLIARTDALSAKLLTSDVDERDRDFLTGGRTPEGFFEIRDGLEPAIARSLASAPYADVLWFETSTPDMGEARAPERRPDRSLPGGAGRARLQVPVRHPGRLPRAERGDVRARPRLRGGGDDGVRPPAGARVRARGAGLHRDASSARGRRGLLRPGRARDLRRRVLDARAQGLHRGGAVRLESLTAGGSRRAESGSAAGSARCPCSARRVVLPILSRRAPRDQQAFRNPKTRPRRFPLTTPDRSGG